MCCAAERDCTPPAVVQITPAKGAVGVQSDVKVVLVFSKKMNHLSVQQAYQSMDLPAAQVDWSWTDTATGEQLTIAPRSPLQYADGVAKTYSFMLAGTATDTVGNPLPTTAWSFSTLRRLKASIGLLGSLTGAVSYNPMTNAYSAGEAPGIFYSIGGYVYTKLLFTFDMAPVFTSATRVEKAALRVYQAGVYGHPYDPASGNGYFGTVDADSLTFSSIDASLFSSVPLRSDIGVLSSNETIEWKSLDVTGSVQDDLANRASRASRSQFRLYFTMAKLEETWVDFDRNGMAPVLDVTYLTP
jgi:hypothetical protein